MSVCVLFIAQFVFLFSHDLFHDNLNFPMGWEYRTSYSYWTTRGNFIILMCFALPALVWHLSDFKEKNEPKTKLVAAVSFYPVFLTVMLLGMVGYSVVASGALEMIHCPEADPESEFGYWCHPKPSNGIVSLVLVPLATLLVLSLLKLILAVSSRFNRNK